MVEKIKEGELTACPWCGAEGRKQFLYSPETEQLVGGRRTCDCGYNFTDYGDVGFVKKPGKKPVIWIQGNRADSVAINSEQAMAVLDNPRMLSSLRVLVKGEQNNG